MDSNDSVLTAVDDFPMTDRMYEDDSHDSLFIDEVSSVLSAVAATVVVVMAAVAVLLMVCCR